MAYPKPPPVTKIFDNGLEFELAFCPINCRYRLSVGFPQHLVSSKVAAGVHFAERISLIQHEASSVSDCLLALAQAITEIEAIDDEGVTGEGETDTA